MKTIKFIKSPVGKFGLSYTIGQEVEISAEQADELINAEYAELVEQEVEVKPSKKTK